MNRHRPPAQMGRPDDKTRNLPGVLTWAVLGTLSAYWVYYGVGEIKSDSDAWNGPVLLVLGAFCVAMCVNAAGHHLSLKYRDEKGHPLPVRNLTGAEQLAIRCRCGHLVNSHRDGGVCEIVAHPGTGHGDDKDCDCNGFRSRADYYA